MTLPAKIAANLPEHASPNRDVPAVSIIVVNYRTRDMTLGCLRSIVRETSRSSYEILLVDNASSDGIIEAVRQELPAVKCIALQENIGFARANNVAAELASGSYILLLNPDTIVLDGAIDRLLDFSREKPGAGIWGGQSLRGDRSLDPTSCWRGLSLWSVICRTLSLDTAFPNSRLLNREGYGGWDRLSSRDVDIICGCFMLVERVLWERLNALDGAFFMYGEEADFCLRAAKSGARPAFTPDAVIVHYGGASQQVETDKIIRKLSARAELIKRHLSPATRSLGLYVNSLLPLVRAVGYGAAAHASQRQEHKDIARIWRSVWSRRKSWRNGFEPSAHPTLEPAH